MINRQKGYGLTACLPIHMKLNEMTINSIVELQFNYMREKHKVISVLLYKITGTVYVSAIKSAGEVLPAKRLKNFCLVYKTESGVYTYTNLSPRSISYNGQNLYALESDQDAPIVNHRNAYRLFVGVPITAKITSDGTTMCCNFFLKDISMTGMGILGIHRFDKFAKIEISFRVNDNTMETLIGSIIHTYELKNGKGFLYGCEFDEPSETIGKYVTNQLAIMELNKAIK